MASRISRGAPPTNSEGNTIGVNGKGQGLMGLGRYASGSGKWEPSVVYLIVLVILEIVLYGYLRMAFKSVHGG